MYTADYTRGIGGTAGSLMSNVSGGPIGGAQLQMADGRDSSVATQVGGQLLASQRNNDTERDITRMNTESAERIAAGNRGTQSLLGLFDTAAGLITNFRGQDVNRDINDFATRAGIFNNAFTGVTNIANTEALLNGQMRNNLLQLAFQDSPTQVPQATATQLQIPPAAQVTAPVVQPSNPNQGGGQQPVAGANMSNALNMLRGFR